jgi:hypothetical protein
MFLLRLMLVAALAGAIAPYSAAAESQSTPGVSDIQIKIGQTMEEFELLCFHCLHTTDK